MTDLCGACGSVYGHSPACRALRASNYIQERGRLQLAYADDLRPGGILFVPDPPDWTPIKYLGVAFVSCALGFGAACWVLL